ncbi:MAG: hypothetical protein LUD19_03430 [Clostridia bacterium]|nr:hypothetical protein [Clostridia bacterium]
MDEGTNHLARVLHSRMNDNRNAYSDLVLDFGVIQDDYSLLTNTYPIPIPKTDYLVLRQLTLGETGAVLTNTSTKEAHEHTGSGTHSHDGGSHSGHESGDGMHTHSGGSHTHGSAGEHSHDVYIPEKMRWLKPGDRVLVAWVQHDAIVLDIICPATDIG